MSSVAKLFMMLSGKNAGVIEGESRVKPYENQIVIDDWSWNYAFDASAPEGKKDIPVPSVLAFGKLMDRASSGMLSAMKTGDELTALITLEEAAQEQFQLIIELQQARLLSYVLNVKDEEKGGVVDEAWTLDYRSVEFRYTISGNDGEITTGALVRPIWGSTEPPKSQTAANEQIRKLAANLSPDQLDQLWKLLKEDSDKRTLTAGSTTTTLDA